MTKEKPSTNGARPRVLIKFNGYAKFNDPYSYFWPDRSSARWRAPRQSRGRSYASIRIADFGDSDADTTSNCHTDTADGFA